MIMMIPENTSRKIDGLGRLVVPKGLRERFNIGADDELEFYTYGKFICFTKKEDEDEKRELARNLLKELGVEIPEEL